MFAFNISNVGQIDFFLVQIIGGLKQNQGVFDDGLIETPSVNGSLS